MQLYSASYFQPENLHGLLIQASIAKPPRFKIDGIARELVPPKHLLYGIKNNTITSEQYHQEYLSILTKADRSGLSLLDHWLGSLQDLTYTILCYELEGHFCHRNSVMGAIKETRPEIYGGQDVSNR